MVDGFAITGPVQIDGNRGAERCARTGGQGNDAVGQKNSFIDVVGDEQDGFPALSPDRFDFVLERGASESIERAEWFIQKENLRVHGQGPRHRNPLAHPAREFRRFFVSRRDEVYQGNMVFCMVALLCFGPIGKNLVDCQINIFVDSHPGQQRIRLKNNGAVWASPGHLQIVEGESSAVRGAQPGDQGKQRGFAGARIAHDGHELAAFHRQIDVVQHFGPRRSSIVSLGYVFEFEKCHGAFITWDGRTSVVADCLRCFSCSRCFKPAFRDTHEAVEDKSDDADGHDAEDDVFINERVVLLPEKAAHARPAGEHLRRDNHQPGNP